jgi:hypothetical protein
MIKQFLCQLFSAQCKLTSLRLDISNEFRDGFIHQCLQSNSYHSSNFIQYQVQSCCITLRRLHIRLNHTCFLENLIKYVRNLEEMSVEFDYTMSSYVLQTSNIESLSQSNENWFNKVRKKQRIIIVFFI